MAVNQALDSEPPQLCLQLDSTTQPELMPLQDSTPMVHIQAHLSQCCDDATTSSQLSQ